MIDIDLLGLRELCQEFALRVVELLRHHELEDRDEIPSVVGVSQVGDAQIGQANDLPVPTRTPAQLQDGAETWYAETLSMRRDL